MANLFNAFKWIKNLNLDAQAAVRASREWASAIEETAADS